MFRLYFLYDSLTIEIKFSHRSLSLESSGFVLGTGSSHSTGSSHGPVVGFFEEKPFLSEDPHHHRLLPDIVAQATLDFFYKD